MGSCSECEWSNTGLLNLGNKDSARWVCHGCCKRAIDERDQLKARLAWLERDYGPFPSFAMTVDDHPPRQVKVPWPYGNKKGGA